MEDKKKIIEAFGEVMKMTRNYSDMVSLEYVEERGEEFAVATFENGGVKRACITGDSGVGGVNGHIKSNLKEQT